MDMEEMDGMQDEGQEPGKGGAIAIIVKKKLGGEMGGDGESEGGAMCPKCGCKLKIEEAD